VSAVIAPGIAPGLAPPAAETSPPSSGTDSRSPVTGKSFADTVAERRATQDAAEHAANQAAPDTAPGPGPQAASEPNAPPGAPTADTSTEVGRLLALAQELLQANTEALNATPKTDVPLLDRPAGAGDTETELIDTAAMEALMAQTLLVRTPVAETDVTIAPIALVAASAEAAGSEAPSALDGLQQAISDVAGAGLPTEAATGDMTPAAVPADATIADVPGLIDVPEATPVATPAPSMTAEAGATAQENADASTQPMAVLAAQVASEDAPALSEPQTDVLVQPEPATEAPASSLVEGDETAMLSGAAASTGARASEPADEPEPRRTRVEASTTTAMPQTAPGMQGDTLAPAAGTGRVEVATGGAVTSQIANTVQSAVLRGEHEVRLVLNPPELGRVEITIVESSGGIRVQMLADQPGARELIERQLPLLQQALAARDVRVERMEVGRPGESASAQEWSNSQGSNDGQRQRGQQDGGSPDWSPLAAMGMGLTESARVVRPSAVAAGGLDVMA